MKATLISDKKTIENMKDFTKHFSEITIQDIPLVGGKNASLGEMYTALSSKGITVPEGFAITSKAYWFFLNENNFIPKLTKLLSTLDATSFNNLSDIGSKARGLILSGKFPESLKKNILEAYYYKDITILV